MPEAAAAAPCRRSQVFDLRKTPAIETPAYAILKKTAAYEVRR